jgi:pimeloyl-ACP methyl ester carboxylesterase
MATYVLIHGAGDSAFYWHLLAPELRERGHEVIAMDLPCDDESASLSDYADTVVDAIGDRTELVVVAQSFGAFTAPLVCERVPVDLMVLVAGMIPSPEEKGEDWFANTGYESAARDQDFDGDSDMAVFFHDVEPAVAVEALTRGRDQAETPGLDRGRWMPGRTYPRGTCSVARTASFRRNGCAGSSVSGLASPPTRWVAATALPSAVRRSSPSAWRRIGPQRPSPTRGYTVTLDSFQTPLAAASRA